MMTSSNGNIFRVTGPLCGEFPAQWPVARSFDVFFDLRLNKRLSKHSKRRRSETPRAHYDVTVMSRLCRAFWVASSGHHKEIIHYNNQRYIWEQISNFEVNGVSADGLDHLPVQWCIGTARISYIHWWPDGGKISAFFAGRGEDDDLLFCYVIHTCVV